MLKKFFAIFTGSKPATETPQTVEGVVPPPTPEEEEQKMLGFLFPETLSAYKTKKARMEKEIEEAWSQHDKLVKQGWSVISGTGAGAELERRRIWREEKDRLGKAEDHAHCLRQTLEFLDDTFRQSEKDRYLSEGVEIFRSPWKDTSCRVVVKWQEKFLRLDVRRKPIPAGGYGPSFVHWVYEYLYQFNVRELEAIEQFQTSDKTCTKPHLHDGTSFTRHCPSCGEMVRDLKPIPDCSQYHAEKKDLGDKFCVDCGQQL